MAAGQAGSEEGLLLAGVPGGKGLPLGNAEGLGEGTMALWVGSALSYASPLFVV